MDLVVQVVASFLIGFTFSGIGAWLAGKYYAHRRNVEEFEELMGLMHEIMTCNHEWIMLGKRTDGELLVSDYECVKCGLVRTDIILQ